MGLLFIFQCALTREKEVKPEKNLVLLQLPLQLVYKDICPVCGKKILPCQIEPEAGVGLENALEKIAQKYQINLIEIKPSCPEKDFDCQLKAGKEWAKRNQAEYILAVVLFCWQERKGTSLSVSEPARVGFHLHFFSSDSGKRVFEGEFLEEQIPLSENLFEIGKFIKRGGRWITAQELAGEGLEKIFQDFCKWREANAGNSLN